MGCSSLNLWVERVACKKFGIGQEALSGKTSRIRDGGECSPSSRLTWVRYFFFSPPPAFKSFTVSPGSRFRDGPTGVSTVE